MRKKNNLILFYFGSLLQIQDFLSIATTLSYPIADSVSETLLKNNKASLGILSFMNKALLPLLIITIALVAGCVGQQPGERVADMVAREPLYAVSEQGVSYFDGVNGFLARPLPSGAYPGVVLIHEWWGLNDNIKDMARELAGQGYVALAVDLFDGKVATTSDQARQLVSSLDQAKALDNMKAAVAYLRQQGTAKVASLGWCFGGGQSLQLSLADGLDATIIYYGHTLADEAELRSVDGPVLGIFGEADASIPVSSVREFDAALDRLGIQNEIYIYPGVGHAFANPTGANYAPAETKDAWEKTLAFLERNLRRSTELPPPAYMPQINPADFVQGVTNPYFTLTPGRTLVYESIAEEGIERNEVYTTYDRRVVLGISAVVVWDRVWLNGSLIEDTKDWFAQDKEGNVWYLGEDSKEIAAGKVVSTHGSWESGVDGAQPGIIMKANPVVGDTYRQEFYSGEAEDVGEVIALGVSVSVPYGFFTGCLKTNDTTRLEPGFEEHKTYCPAVGGVVLEEAIDGQRVELIGIRVNETINVTAPTEELKPGISPEEAKEIGLRQVPGTVTDVAIETKFGKIAYVVEIIAAADGVETDVIVDVDTGEVLGIER
jgi:carboxymethylenebutenolidase